MKKSLAILILFLTGSAHAAQFIKVMKSNTVVGYKEPTLQSKMLSVFGEGDLVEVLLLKDGWYKVKIPYTQGYFLTGWIPQSNPNITIVQGNRPVPQNQNQVVAVPVAGEDEPKSRKKSSAKSQRSENDDTWGDTDQFIKAFGGPVYNLYKYGAFQYKFGAGYEIPLTQTFKLGIPLSFTTGDGFNVVMGGVEGLYSFYVGSFAITPRVGAGFEHFFGGGKSFQALSGELGFSFDFHISDNLALGVEPFTGQAMFWNNTESIDKIPFNIRAQSLIVIRGKW